MRSSGAFSAEHVCAEEKTGILWPVTRLILLIGALLAMVTSVSFAFVWIPRKAIGRMKGVKHLSVRAVPLLAVLMLAAFVLAVARATPYELTMPDLKTITICTSTIVFAILSVLAVVLAIRSFRFEMNRAARIHSMLVSIACLGMTWYMAYWGLVGLRIWAPW